MRAELPGGYVEILGEIKQRIQQARLRTILADADGFFIVQLLSGARRRRPTRSTACR